MKKNIESVITRNGVYGKETTLAKATLMSGKCGASEQAPNHSRKVTVKTVEDRYHGTERNMRIVILDPRNGRETYVDLAIGDDEIMLSVKGAKIAKTFPHETLKLTTFVLAEK